MLRHVSVAATPQDHALPTARTQQMPERSVSPVRRETAEDHGYGIVVVSVSSGKVLYVNETASRYLERDHKTGDTIVSAIEDFVRQMKATGDSGTHERPPVETARLANKEGSPLCLEAFALRNGSDVASARVVITMHDCAPAVTPTDA